MIKDYAFWVIGVIESKDPETALHTIKHENSGGFGQCYLPQLAMAPDDQYNVLINRLAHNYGARHLAVDYIASAYQDFTKSIKLDSSDQDFTPLDVLIALGFTGSSITGATVKTHQQFSEYGAEYTYGLHKDLATFIYRIEPSKAQTNEIITNFFDHYKFFRDRILDDGNLMEHLNNIGVDVHNMTSERIKKTTFTQIYQDLSDKKQNATSASNQDLNDQRRQILSRISSQGNGGDHITVTFNKAKPPTLIPFVPKDKNHDPLADIHNGRILQQSLADKLASFRARQQFEIVAQNMGAKFDMPRRHAIFSGPPGTGKTTLAEDIGDFFSDLGILAKGHVHKTTGTKTIGKYVGQTAPLVQDAVKKALGGILFIDEIYQWYDEPRFGNEAVNELLAQMEEHREDLIVIVAGYSDKVKQVLSMNAGLLSRFSTEFEFTHFTREELSQILDLNLNKMRIDMDPDARAAFIDYLERQKQQLGDNFANARTLEVLLDHVVTAHAVNWSNLKPKPTEHGNLVHIFTNEMLTLNVNDVNAAIAQGVKPEQRRTIGFGFGSSEPH